MSPWTPLVGLLAGLVSREAWGWIPWATRLTLYAETLLLPSPRREVRRAEWLAELQADFDERRLAGFVWTVALIPVVVREAFVWRLAPDAITTDLAYVRRRAAVVRSLRAMLIGQAGLCMLASVFYWPGAIALGIVIEGGGVLPWLPLIAAPIMPLLGAGATVLALAGIYDCGRRLALLSLVQTLILNVELNQADSSRLSVDSNITLVDVDAYLNGVNLATKDEIREMYRLFGLS